MSVVSIREHYVLVKKKYAEMHASLSSYQISLIENEWSKIMRLRRHLADQKARQRKGSQMTLGHPHSLIVPCDRTFTDVIEQTESSLRGLLLNFESHYLNLM